LSNYPNLEHLLGNVVHDVKHAFLNLEGSALSKVLYEYQKTYGLSARKYAEQTYPMWKIGKTKLSGQTMERLIQLVPPVLSPSTRFDLLVKVVERHRKSPPKRNIRINMESTHAGLIEINKLLAEAAKLDNSLTPIPEQAMNAACWLCGNDMLVARALLAEAREKENEVICAQAKRDIDLLKSAIYSRKVSSAQYRIDLPTQTLVITAYTPSKCYVATACFGEGAVETEVLRRWRDESLINSEYGRKFIVWYYNNGEAIAGLTGNRLIKAVVKTGISVVAKIIQLSQSISK
jgi:hypothetical protein